MRRVLVYFSWDCARWKQRALAASESGHRGYAYRQAAVRTTMREFCVTKWQAVPSELVKRSVLLSSDVATLVYVLEKQS